ncbi:hypothetical protein GF373_13780 [bacterium]|nr:hypothetical protein [bacterium]
MSFQKITQPVIAGTGILTLDAVPVMKEDNADTYRLYAGGSALNVSMILQTMGWTAFPVGKIGPDRAGEYFLNDIAPFDVNRESILQNPGDATPVYIQQQDGEEHKFVRECPFCGYEFVHYQPLTMDEAKTITNRLPGRIDVFYLERVSPGAFQLARDSKEKGAFVFFEPNRVDDESLFLDCLRLADVYKYSRERLHETQAISDSISIPLEIESQGKQGLQFRVHHGQTRGDWNYIPAPAVPKFTDAAGAGDWLSAGFLNYVCKSEEPFPFGTPLVTEALSAGQSTAVMNCAFESARGFLYQEKPIQIGTDFCPQCAGDPK